MYRKNLSGWIKHWDFMLLDTICLFLSFCLSFYLRHHKWTVFQIGTYRFMIFPLLLTNLLIAIMTDQFKDVIHRGYYIEFTKIFEQVVLVSASSVLYLFIVKHGNEYSRIVLGLTAVIYLFIGFLCRIILKCSVRHKGISYGKKQLLLIASEKDMSKMIESLTSSNYGTYHIKGISIIDKDMQGEVFKGFPVVCNFENITKYIQREWIDEVMISDDMGRFISDEDVVRFVTMGVTVHRILSYEMYEGGTKKSLEKIAGTFCLTSSMNVMTVGQRVKKRILDIFGALVGCLITAIVVLFVGPIIYIKSPGPIFFVQERIGRNGKHFKMYKLRSMYMDAEARKAELMAQNELDSDFMFKMEDDPRIIGGKNGVGGFIRRFSLDEFPQFFNVLKGDMSLVGTRPPTLDEWELYEEHHRARMATVPGITGMWQTSGRSDITDFEEVVRLDTEYIENWNIGLDIKIILKTVLQTLKSEGAK